MQLQYGQMPNISFFKKRNYIVAFKLNPHGRMLGLQFQTGIRNFKLRFLQKWIKKQMWLYQNKFDEKIDS
jgi:hypothetical protein